MRYQGKVASIILKKVFSYVLLLLFIMGIAAQAQAASTRIVVLPFYVESGRSITDSGVARQHYIRTMIPINNKLNDKGYDVVDPFASESLEKEFNNWVDRSKQDSSLVATDLCKKYSADVALILWLEMDINKTGDGYYDADGSLLCKGYDSAGNSVIGIEKPFELTRRSRKRAIADLEKEVGYEVVRKITAGSDKWGHTRGSALDRNIKKYKQQIMVRLEGITDYELLEIFDKVLKTTTGVTSAEEYGSNLNPSSAQKSFATWIVNIDGTTHTHLRANVIKRIHDILEQGGRTVIDNVPYRYTPDEVNLLRGIRQGTANRQVIQFVIDRELVRDREMSGRHNPYKNKGINLVGDGFN